jgi:hypothetical protein
MDASRALAKNSVDASMFLGPLGEGEGEVLTLEEQAVLQGWLSFFTNKYYQVGVLDVGLLPGGGGGGDEREE